jgi:hypothetical protein
MYCYNFFIKLLYKIGVIPRQTPKSMAVLSKLIIKSKLQNGTVARSGLLEQSNTSRPSGNDLSKLFEQYSRFKLGGKGGKYTNLLFSMWSSSRFL